MANSEYKSLDERVKLYEACLSSGELSWSILKDLGYRNRINSLIKNGIITKNPNGRGYFFVNKDEILDLSKKHELLGALINCLNLYPNDKNILKQIIIYYFKKNMISESAEAFKRLANIYYEDGILIHDRDSEDYYFIIFCLILFNVLLDNCESLNEEFLQEFLDNYNYDEVFTTNFNRLINLIRGKEYLSAKREIYSLIKDRHVKNPESVETNLYIMLKIVEYIGHQRSNYKKDFFNTLNGMLDDRPLSWEKINEYINANSVNKYIVAIKFLSGDNSVRPRKDEIEKDEVLSFLYAGHYRAALASFSDDDQITYEERLLKKVITIKIEAEKQEERVSLDNILDIISIYNSFKTSSCDIFRILEHYFNIYFEGDLNKVFLANLILSFELLLFPFSIHELLFSLYQLKHNAYDSLKTKYSIPIASDDITNPYTIPNLIIDDITKTIECIQINYPANFDDSALLQSRPIINEAKRRGLLPKTINLLKSYARKRHFTSDDITDLSDEVPFRLFGPFKTIECEIKDNDTYFVDLIIYRRRCYILLRKKVNTNLDPNDPLYQLLSSKLPDKKVLSMLINIFMRTDNIDAAIASNLLLLMSPDIIEEEKGRYDEELLTLFNKKIIASSLESVAENDLTSFIREVLNESIISTKKDDLTFYYDGQKPLEILGPFNLDQKIQIKATIDRYYLDEVTYGNDKYIIIRKPKTNLNELSSYIPPKSLNEQDGTKMLLSQLMKFINNKEYSANNLLFLAQRYDSLDEQDTAKVFYLLYIHLLEEKKCKIPEWVLQKLQSMLSQMVLLPNSSS